jgi:hypothetical protein
MVRLLFTLLVLLAVSLGRLSAQTPAAPGPAKAEDNALFREIAALDAELFEAYNTRNIDKLAVLFAPNLEFYHDTGGLANYEQNLAAFKSLFARNDGLHRDLVPGTLEVYPIKDYGAIEVGSHRFCHLENGKQDCGTFKFLMLWQKQGGAWKVTRVMSYGH